MIKENLKKILWLRTAKRIVESLPGKAGSVLLKNNTIRNVFNNIYNIGTYNNLISPILGKPKVADTFLWNINFQKSNILFPVLPDLDRSWNAALIWGWSEYKEIRFFYEFYLKNNPTGSFWDVGANDGTHTYLFASQGYKCTSFEPQPSCIKYINKVIESNNFDNVNVFQTALGNDDGGEIDFYISKSSWFSSTNKESVERFEPATQIKVPVIKLDSHYQKSGDAPDIVKIDVEGFEWEAIKGGSEVFRTAKPVIFVEIDMSTDNLKRICDLLKNFSYKAYKFVRNQTLPFIAEPFDISKPEQFIKSGNFDFIFLPEGDFRNKFEQTVVSEA